MAPPSFTRFPNLPRDIQNMIWNLHLATRMGPEVPRAYHVWQALAIKRKFHAARWQSWAHLDFDADMPLLADIRSASMEILEASGAEPEIRQMVVDASRDLMILKGQREQRCSEPEMTGAPLPIQYLAINHRDIEIHWPDGLHWAAASNLDPVFPNLRVFFIILDPDDLRTARAVPEWRPRPPSIPYPDEDHQTWPRTWYTKDRAYFAISETEAKTVGGAVEGIDIHVRSKYELFSTRGVAFKIMTWRDRG
ncbi:hypothetical protein ACJZ2D_013607 [Fusarium nematophilum]